MHFRANLEDRFLLHPSNVPGVSLIGIQLTRCDNYQLWVCSISDALSMKNKICFADGFCKREDIPKNLRFQWDWCNVVVKGWLTTCC